MKVRIDGLLKTTGIGLAVIIGVVVALSLAFSRTVTKPMQALAEGARRLGKGDFDVRLDIRSRDEFGDMGRVFNMVVPQLKKHYETQQSLSLANEVQQSLMPASAPSIDGLDISGSTIYCDKTGGDYFDYLSEEAAHNREVCIVIGDVSDHGIPSALLMTSARAMLRQSAAQNQWISQVVTQVNHQLNRDVADSGQFMSLFCCRIDVEKKTLHWVRAGHEPALVYHSKKDTFEELRGEGLPLGVFPDSQYKDNQRPIEAGEIIVLSTDGIWETRNPGGQMFGKENVNRIVRQHAGDSAANIKKAVIDAVTQFRQPLPQDDDITLVIIKVTK